jgi:hypothetical protein
MLTAKIQVLGYEETEGAKYMSIQTQNTLHPSLSMVGIGLATQSSGTPKGCVHTQPV